MFLNVEGNQVHYEITGHGNPILLLHGWGSSISSFKPVIEWLQKDHKVFALDFPGFGKSDKPKLPWDVSNYSDFLEKFMTQISLQKTDIIAHSFGGRIAIKLAVEKPEKINKLILIDSAGIKPRRTFQYYFKTILAKIAKIFPKILGRPGSEIKTWIYQHIGSKDFQKAGPMRSTFIKVIKEDLTPLLKNIMAPTLLIWGENDRETPVYMAKIMETEIQDAGLVILKNAGHYSYLDKFQHFCIVIDNFLKSINNNPSQNSDRDENGIKIKKMFSSIAHRYDLLNSMLSFGRDKYWRRYSINKLHLIPGEKYIDIAAGTGDMAIEITKRSLEGIQVVAVDFSRDMIDIGKKKINKLHMDGKVKFQLGDSQNLPFNDDSFHSAVCAFGVRNFSNKLKGIKEMRRVIKKNGQIIVLDFFKPQNRIFRYFYYFYFKKALPLIGGLISGKFSAYHYLPTSVMDFYSQDELRAIMLKAGLKKVSYFNLTFGSVSVHIGYK